MNYHCPECQQNLKHKYLDFKCYKNPIAPFKLCYACVCSHCSTLIDINPIPKLNNARELFLDLRIYFIVFASLDAKNHAKEFDLTSDEALFIVLIFGFIMIYITNRLFKDKISADWPYWCKVGDPTPSEQP